MFQSIFPFKDNKVIFMLSYCAHQIAKREGEVLQWAFTEELMQDFPLCSHTYLFGQLLANTTESLPTVFTDLTVVM